MKLLTGIGMFLFCLVAGCTIHRFIIGVGVQARTADYQESRQQLRISSGECVRTGYAGRYYEKVYNCGGKVLRESGL